MAKAIFGDHSYIAFLYGDVADESEFLRLVGIGEDLSFYEGGGILTGTDSPGRR